MGKMGAGPRWKRESSLLTPWLSREGSDPIFPMDHMTFNNRFRDLDPFSTYLHEKFAASFVSPEPLYVATWGYGHRMRLRSGCPLVRCAAGMESGAFPFSTHC